MIFVNISDEPPVYNSLCPLVKDIVIKFIWLLGDTKLGNILLENILIKMNFFKPPYPYHSFFIHNTCWGLQFTGAYTQGILNLRFVPNLT